MWSNWCRSYCRQADVQGTSQFHNCRFPHIIEADQVTHYGLFEIHSSAKTESHLSPVLAQVCHMKHSLLFMKKYSYLTFCFTFAFYLSCPSWLTPSDVFFFISTSTLKFMLWHALLCSSDGYAFPSVCCFSALTNDMHLSIFMKASA